MLEKGRDLGARSRYWAHLFRVDFLDPSAGLGSDCRVFSRNIERINTGFLKVLPL